MNNAPGEKKSVELTYEFHFKGGELSSCSAKQHNDHTDLDTSVLIYKIKTEN